MAIAEPREFRTSPLVRAMPAFYAVICLFFLIIGLRDPTLPRWWGMLVACELLFGTMGILSLWYASVRVWVDGEGIQTQSLGRRKAIRWDELTSYKPYAKGGLKLTDCNGRQMDISLSSLKDGVELETLIRPYGEAIQAQAAQKEATLPFVCRPIGLAAGIVATVILALLLNGLLSFSIVDAPPRPRDMPYLWLFFGLMNGLILLLGISLSAKVTFFPNRFERWVGFWRKSIPTEVVQKAILQVPYERVGTTGSIRKLRLLVGERQVRWTLPGGNSQAIENALRLMLPPEKIELDNSLKERYDLPGRAEWARAAVGQEHRFFSQGRGVLILMFVVYVPLPLFLIGVGANFARSVPGYERIAIGTLVGGVAVGIYLLVGAITMLTNRVTINPSGIETRNAFWTKRIPWLEVKRIQITGTSYVGGSAIVKSVNGAVRLTGLENQWRVNDLAKAFGELHHIPVDDRTRPNLTM